MPSKAKFLGLKLVQTKSFGLILKYFKKLKKKV
jgi:hypothetical protein